jgi:glycosyltransferase involved in cell wall biosynthesis
VIPSVGPLRGGPSTMIRDLAGSLARAGIEIHVATTDDNGPETLPVQYRVPVVREGVTYWFFPRQSRFYTFSWPLGVWLARHVSDFDLLHIHALFSFSTLLAAYWARRRGVPYIVRPLGTLNTWGMKNRRPWLKKLSFRVLERRVLKHAARVHFTSGQERLEAETLHVEAEAAVIPNPLPPGSLFPSVAGRFRACYPQLKSRRIILFLSRLDEKKGVELLLCAFASVRQQVPDALLVIAGEGEKILVRKLKVRARKLEIDSAVLWAGFLAGDDKRAALADADVFVLPSYSENFGIAVAEAMAAGVPVVVSDQVGIHHDITEAAAGVVVKCDAAPLALALIRLLNDASLRRAMGRNGRRLAQKRYSLEAVTDKVLCLYNGITS